MQPYDLTSAAASRLTRSQLQGDGCGGVLWLEQRPDFEGRTVLVHRRRSGEIEPLGDPSWSIGSAIGGYGGRAVVVTPDGVFVVLAKSHEIWFTPHGGDPQLFFTSPPQWALGDLVITRRGLTAIREVHGDSLSRSLVVVHPNNDVEELYRGPHFLFDLNVSPSGDTVAFVHWEHPDMPWDRAQVSVASVPMSGRITSSREFGDADSPAWSPRFSSAGVFSFQQTIGEWITPVVLEGDVLRSFGRECDFDDVPWTSIGNSHLVRENGEVLAVARTPHGDELRFLTSSTEIEQVSGVTISDLCEVDGEVFALVATSSERTALFALDEKSGRLLPLLEATPREVTSLRSHPIVARDGRRIEGYFATPPGVERPPLIVFCHGGPTDRVDPSFDPAVQVFCSRGFAVAAPNYRGSTGLGRSYRTALDGLWGVADVDDVIAYTLGLVADGLVDDRALFIRGGSAGGFTALRALESGLFLGATGNYACTDLLRLAMVTHDFELHYLDTLLGPLATHEATYIDRSPINHPERLNGSVLLLQGSDDVVVPAAQTKSFVEACEQRGVEVRAQIFPNEGHGFRSAATLIAAWSAELEHYERLLHRDAASR